MKGQSDQERIEERRRRRNANRDRRRATGISYGHNGRKERGHGKGRIIDHTAEGNR